ncbi:Retrovirus-related Pol polyprotein from transposon gypsy [Dictyocoela muelleri]|nr:Retrovirus-related Pol polyprotein from transposon gypsy [Dictyocoela muelleri]
MGDFFFTKIDLHSRYYQLKINEKDIHKTAFSLHNEKYEFLRLAFGLKNAPYHFQQAMNELFLGYECVKIFLDDILIFSRNEIDHKIRVSNVLNKFFNSHVKINFKKSEFF